MESYYQGGLIEALDRCAEDPDNVPAISRLARLVADGLLKHSDGCVVDGEDVGVLHAVVTALCHAINRGTDDPPVPAASDTDTSAPAVPPLRLVPTSEGA